MSFLQNSMHLTLKIMPAWSMPRTLSKNTAVALYIYLYTNEHTVIPRYSTGNYGSKVMKLVVSENTSYVHQFFVLKNKEINLDKARAGHRCSNDDAEVMVGRCIVRLSLIHI